MFRRQYPRTTHTKIIKEWPITVWADYWLRSIHDKESSLPVNDRQADRKKDSSLSDDRKTSGSEWDVVFHWLASEAGGTRAGAWSAAITAGDRLECGSAGGRRSTVDNHSALVIKLNIIYTRLHVRRHVYVPRTFILNPLNDIKCGLRGGAMTVTVE